ncbi:hypothetical protein JVU11DRAFT_4822 [Chiua virens]|nr:hypothetical protein JVU11DRAFT_4822 [Chiua virens]
MSSLFGLAEKVLSNTSNGSQSQVHKTGGHEYNSPHHRQQPEGGFSTQEVLSHADDVDDESKGYIAKAISHVHDNPEEHSREVSGGDMGKYAPMIISAFSSVSSKSGIDVSKLMSGGLGEGGGNQVMGMLMKEVSKNFMGGGEEKQSAMNGAAMTLTKLVAQKQLSAFIGGSNSGGLGMLDVGKSLLKSRLG